MYGYYHLHVKIARLTNCVNCDWFRARVEFCADASIEWKLVKYFGWEIIRNGNWCRSSIYRLCHYVSNSILVIVRMCVCFSLLALFYFFGISSNGHGVQRACVWADVPRLFSACVHRKREVRNGRVHNNAMLCAFKRIRTSTITINECCQASDDSYLSLCLSLFLPLAHSSPSHSFCSFCGVYVCVFASN